MNNVQFPLSLLFCPRYKALWFDENCSSLYLGYLGFSFLHTEMLTSTGITHRTSAIQDTTILKFRDQAEGERRKRGSNPLSSELVFT